MRATNLCLIVGLALSMAASGVAQVATVNADDPSITKRPTLDPDNHHFPNYPPAARRAGLSGETKISMCVDLSGKPYGVTVLESSGHPILDEASTSWLNKGARFRPAEAGGTPVAVCNYVFTYVWDLPAGSSMDAMHQSDSYLEASDMAPGDLPVVLSRPQRQPYPPGALARRSSGVIHYSMCIGPTGQMESITILDPNADMELATVGGFWFGASRYKPGQKDGKPVGVCGIEGEYEWVLPVKLPPGQAL